MTYVLVGEAWGEEEAEAQASFVGPSGKELRSQLREVGMDNYYLTNVFNLRPLGNDITKLTGGPKTALPHYPPISHRPNRWVRVEFASELERLTAEIKFHEPRCIFALGNTALWALTKQTGISDHRGYEASFRGIPVIPTWHPAAVLRSYNLRTICLMDFDKGMNRFKDLERRVYIPESKDDLRIMVDECIAYPGLVACDIETAQTRITEVGFAPKPDRAYTVPFETLEGKSYWPSDELEQAAWKAVETICRECNFIGHNFSYDMQYLWKVAGIPCPKFIGDTMLLHHALQPEMRKSLGFLASLYTHAPRWKHVRLENKE